MRIAIAATEMSDNGQICRQGARATYFLVFDENAQIAEAFENPFKDYDHGVGIHVADFLADKKVKVVAAAHIGTGFANALDSKGVGHVETEGTIRDAVEAIIGSSV